MKNILYSLAAVFILASCKTSKDYLQRSDDDKTLYDIVKKLNKQSDDVNAIKAIAVVYQQVQERHLKNINTFNDLADIKKWDKLINEYNILQHMFEVIDNSPAARRLVRPINYQNDVDRVKQAAAKDYYNVGDDYLAKSGRENARKAYYAFKKAETFVSNFQDTKAKMEEAYNSSIVNVVINPIQDNSFFFNTGWGNMGYNYSNEYFQQNLVSDLGGKYATRYPARFYTEWEARRDNVQPDLVVDLTLRNMDIPRPLVNNYSRNVSKQIEIGSDTSGKPVYKTVYATLNIQRQYFNARAQMDVNIVDVTTGRNVDYGTFNDQFNWQAEVGTFTGDRRALSSNDWALINNNNFNLPRREDILNQLYRNIYPQVKNKISNRVDW